MCEIKTDLGTFSGETLKDAQRALRKAEREEAKRRGERAAEYTVAHGRAERAAWHLFRLQGGGCLWAIRECAPGWSGRVRVSETGRWHVRVSTADGTAEMACCCGDRPITLLAQASGDLLAVRVRESGGGSVWYAVGVSGDAVATESLTGLNLGRYEGD